MSDQALKPLPIVKTAMDRESAQATLRAAWERMLGGPLPKPPENRLEVLEEEKVATVLRQRVRYFAEAEESTEAYLLLPQKRAGRLPGVVVFHPTTNDNILQPAGLAEQTDKHIGLRLAERGFVALCPRCFLYNFPGTKLEETVEIIKRRHPGWTGMRKMLWDGQRALDVLAHHSAVDSSRLGAIGHSLGAKETLYLTAFDSRIRAAVFSEGGIGLPLSNWEAPWYLGTQIKQDDFHHDHHELLALCAPRPFLLLGGDSADGEVSRAYVEAARPFYALFQQEDRLQLINHKQGHAFPREAQTAAYGWLERHLR